MTAAGVHCVRTGTVGAAEQRCGQGWQTLAAAEESHKCEVFSIGEPEVDVDRKGSPYLSARGHGGKHGTPTVEQVSQFLGSIDECNDGPSMCQCPEVLEETVGVVRLAPHKRVQQRTAKRIVELLVPQIGEGNVDVMRLVPQEHVQWIDTLITEEVVTGTHLTPHEREQERLEVQSLDILKERIAKCWNCPARPNKEEIAKVAPWPG